ncbi:hypothetical protein CALVIDRAFT_409723 [Calocera viscosa TUFC12733]|uniref:Uncharacterized protein n=1 Tax=Calocera viscosa (strain TUFC12733) TaxID=1330018 RepID=A0A167G8A8_CALVF|nr:hypothetical protein CALVIDRAFT_409723 [Calocera viscosa TUFC12733]
MIAELLAGVLAAAFSGLSHSPTCCHLPQSCTFDTLEQAVARLNLRTPIQLPWRSSRAPTAAQHLPYRVRRKGQASLTFSTG